MSFDFDRITDRSHTNAIKYDLAAARGKPEDAISLWVADMDFPTAPCIQKAIVEKASHGIFGYSRPDSRYYDAVINWFKQRHNFEIKPEWIVNTPGVIFGYSTALKAITKEGDSVLIQQPVYYPFFNIINALGRKVVNNPLVYKDNHYEINFDDFEKKIIEENVKVFLFCSPHNPGGRVWTRSELDRISEICLKHKVFVIADEIHCDITFNNHKHIPFGSLSEQALKNSIVCTSPSKSFNLAGLQFSNIIIPDPEIRKLFMKEYDKTGYDEPGIMGIVAATAAYSEGSQWFDEAKAYIWENILFIEQYVKDHCPEIKVIKPEGSYLVWLDFTAFDYSDKKIDTLILEKAKVWLDRGTMFGPEGEKFQRINAATPRKILTEAVERICKVFSEKE